MKRFLTCLSLFIVSVLCAVCFVACGDKPANEPPIQETFTVVWKNYDGNVLETDTGLVNGVMPTYDGATPTKPEDSDYTYAFSGWNPSVVAVSGNATYTATFNGTPKKPYEAELLSLEGFNDEGDKYYTLSVSNSVSAYDFSNLITVSEEATYTIRHENNPALSADGTVDLDEGGNRIYIDVYSKDGNKHNYFTVDIYRNHLYKIYYSLVYKTLDYFGDVHWDNVDLGDNAYLSVEEGNLVPVPEEFEKRLGFDFDYGDYDFETPLTPGHVDNYIMITGTVKDEMRDFEFVSTTDTCEITRVWIRNENEFTELTIPEYVTKFSDKMDHASHIQKIYWNAVHCINANADDNYGIFWGSFYDDCELILGDKVEYVDRMTFDGNWRLNKITVGSGLKEIGGWGAFGTYCKELYIKDLKQWIEVKYLDNTGYYIGAEKLFLNGELITELTIPDGITEIPAKIFKNGAFRKIVIPDGVSKIGEEAFSGCNQVRELSLPDTLTDIGEWAFAGARITELDIPDSVISIGDYAFSGCSSLTRVVLGTGLENGTVGANAFDGCYIFEVYDKCYFGFGADANLCGKVAKNAYRIIKPNDYIQESFVKKIQSEDGNTYVYYERYNQNELTIERILRGYIGTNDNPKLPDNITHIRYNFGDIEYVVIPESVKVIENGSFYSFNNLERVFYAGKSNFFDAITVKGLDNGGLTENKVYYYSETAPIQEGNFWHYVNGVPTTWSE